MKPRFFVSSVVEGFQECRDSARKGVEDAGGEPVLVNEDMPPASASPRNACLDGVASADVFIAIVGSRGGWTTPSGKVVTEEEYDHAVRLGKPILVFLQDAPRDANASRFADRLSDYTSGHLRSTFADARDLRSKVTKAVKPFIGTMTLPMTTESEITGRLTPSSRHSQETLFGLVIGPERQEEVIDPVRLDDPKLRELVMRIGHESEIGLLDYGFGKEQTISGSALITEQKGSRRDYTANVRIELSDRGIVVFEGNVTGRTPRKSAAEILGTMVVAEEDIEGLAGSMIRFYGRVLDEIDPYQRQQVLLMNAALFGLGHRSIARSPQPRASFPIRMTSGEGPLLAFDTARRIGRPVLRAPDEEVKRIVTMLARRARQ